MPLHEPKLVVKLLSMATIGMLALAMTSSCNRTDRYFEKRLANSEFTMSNDSLFGVFQSVHKEIGFRYFDLLHSSIDSLEARLNDEIPVLDSLYSPIPILGSIRKNQLDTHLGSCLNMKRALYLFNRVDSLLKQHCRDTSSLNGQELLLHPKATKLQIYTYKVIIQEFKLKENDCLLEYL